MADEYGFKRDYFGNRLNVGDKVIYVDAWGGSIYLIKCEVESFTPKMVRTDQGTVKGTRLINIGAL